MATPTINSRPEATVNGVLSQWNAANLPLQYEIENTKWPANSDDLTDTIGSVSDSNGYARLNLSTTNEAYTAKLWVVVTGTTSYNGVHRVRAATVSTITIDFPASGSETGTVQIYYQNYTTLIQVYAGLDPAHTHAADKPMTLIGTIEQRPDTDNITYVDVRNYVKSKINTNWDETQSSWPNDLNIWCDFYIAVAERYDSISAGEVIDFTSAYTEDTVYCHAVHAALQFGSATGGNMGEYLAIDSIYKEANAKWMTTFERPKIIDYNEFFLSIIIESTEDLFILIQEFDINGDLIDYDFLGYADQDYGVYRLSIDYLFTEDSSFASVQLFSGIYTELSEELFIDIDVSCAEIVDAPIDLAVEAISGSQIDGTFTDTSGGVAVHQVYWSLTSGTGFVLLTSLSAGATSFSHTGLSGDTTYYYKVRALINGVVSDFSNEASATTLFVIETAFNSDGVNDYVAISGMGGISVPDNFFISLWIQLNQWPLTSKLYQALFTNRNTGGGGAGSNYISIYFERQNPSPYVEADLVCDLRSSTGVEDKYKMRTVIQQSDYSPGDYIHIAVNFIKDVATYGGGKVWFNGVNTVTDVTVVSTNWPSFLSTLDWGNDRADISNRAAGHKIALGIAGSGVLNQSIVDSLYGDGNGVIVANPKKVLENAGLSLLFYHPFQEESGTNVPDDSGNGKTGTVTNADTTAPPGPTKGWDNW